MLARNRPLNHPLANHRVKTSCSYTLKLAEFTYITRYLPTYALRKSTCHVGMGAFEFVVVFFWWYDPSIITKTDKNQRSWPPCGCSYYWLLDHHWSSQRINCTWAQRASKSNSCAQERYLVVLNCAGIACNSDSNSKHKADRNCRDIYACIHECMHTYIHAYNTHI